jgi:hypothetical protein
MACVCVCVCVCAGVRVCVCVVCAWRDRESGACECDGVTLCVYASMMLYVSMRVFCLHLKNFRQHSGGHPLSMDIKKKTDWRSGGHPLWHLSPWMYHYYAAKY